MTDTRADTKLLIVVGDPDRRLDLSSNLSRVGFHVDALGDAATAMTMMAVNPPDVVFIDGQLPDNAASRLLTRIRADKAASRLPVVWLLDEPARAGDVVSPHPDADDFLSGPADGVALVEMIEQILQIRRVADQLDVGAKSVVEAFLPKPSAG